MPKLFGLEPKVWIPIAGGVGVLVVILYLRSRASGGGDQMAAGSDSGFGAGATAPSSPAILPAASTAPAANSFDDQLANLQIAGIQQQLDQAKAMFGLQYQQAQQQASLFGKYSEAILPGQISLANATLKEQTAEAAVTFQCPGGYGRARGPDGQLYCRAKTSGGILGGIGRAVTGFISGVAQAAPGIGYSAANVAASYAEGQYFPSRPSSPMSYAGLASAHPATVPTAPMPAPFQVSGGNLAPQRAA
jgi:hypothetical protein